MYYLVESGKDGGELRMVRNFDKTAHKMSVLLNHLSINNIEYVDELKSIMASGKYCISVSPNKFSVFSVSIQEDGYIFQGTTEYNHIYNIQVVYYKLDENKNINIQRELDL